MRSKSLMFVLMLLAVAAGVAPLAAKSGQNPSVDGDYIVTFKGAYSGQGTAKVNGSGKKIVWIKGDLNDLTRNKIGHFRVKNMPFTDDGHFSGAGLYICEDGTKVGVSVVGRLEPGDNGVIKKTRIICTFTTGSGAGRIIGSH